MENADFVMEVSMGIRAGRPSEHGKKNIPIVPVPCVRMKEKTLKEWLAKLDEEVNEFKHELMNCYDLEDELGPHDVEYIHPVDKDHLADEGADVCTVIHSICQRLGIDFDKRAEAQCRVNMSNLEKGRL